MWLDLNIVVSMFLGCNKEWARFDIELIVLYKFI